jgi:hypothetical protein
MSDFPIDRHNEIMFPEKEGVDYSKLVLTPEGEYSITKRQDGQKILKHMLDTTGTPQLTVTDLTGNVGGDTILFALNFDHVDSIEISKENYDALRHNVREYKLKNVTLHHGDSTKVFRWQTDILYIDAPWGGPDYKTKKKLDLYLGKERMDLFLKLVLQQKWAPKYVFLKLPRNYNFARLDYPGIKKHKFAIRGYFLVSLEKNGLSDEK